MHGANYALKQNYFILALAVSLIYRNFAAGK